MSFLSVVLLTLFSTGVNAQSEHNPAPNVATTLTEIVRQGDAVVAAYQPENSLASAQQMSSLYFNQFETLEGILGSSDKSGMMAIESAFGRVNSLMMRSHAKADITEAWQTLRTRLTETAARHAAAEADGSASSPWVIFLQSLLILLREGAEAMLVIAALVTYLRRSGAPNRQVHTVYGAAFFAIGASFLTAWIMNQLLAASGAAREGFEGVTMLAASALLFYVGAWLFARRDAERWRNFLQQQTQQAIAAVQTGGEAKTLWLLGGTSFLAVYREGVETIVFYQALIGRAEGQESMLWLGFAAAAMALVLLFLVVRVLSLRLPLKPFFMVTAVLLYAMAVIFAGQGVMELQNAGWLPRTSLALPELPTFGVFASAEGLGLQAALLLLIGFALWRLTKGRTI